MKLLTLLLLLAAGATSAQQSPAPPARNAHQPPTLAPRSNHPMADSIQGLLDRAVARGLPGVQVLLRNGQGTVHIHSGFAHAGSQLPYAAGTPSWLFSITKTYTAVLALQLWERGLLRLDAPIGAYLPAHYLQAVPGHDSITVALLLQHRSGLPNFTALPAFIERQFSTPLQQPSVTERLDLLSGIALRFRPGADFEYSNSNYLLLQVLLEQVSGQDYGTLLRDRILRPAGLTHTWYAPPEDTANVLGFPSAYFDRRGTGVLEDGTRWNAALGKGSGGYGGIAATPDDVLRFMEALRPGGGLLSEAALGLMQQWHGGTRSTQPDYGMGLEYFQYDRAGGPPQWGHEGDGIGCSTLAFYVPANGTYLYLNCNAGRRLPGPLLFAITDLKNELCRYVASYR